MNIKEFVDAYKSKKFMAIKNGEDERSEYIRKELDVKIYLPFRVKRQLAEMVVKNNITEENGVKKYDSINAYIGFVVATIAAHTVLEFNIDDPVADYDLIAESGLLPKIIAEFQESYNECDVLLKLAVAMELEDNNINALVGKFLNGILERLDIAGGALKEKFGDFNIGDMIGNFKEEDLTKLKGFLDRYNK